MLSYLNLLTIGYTTCGSIFNYLCAEICLQDDGIDASFGERENFPVRFALLEEKDSEGADTAISVGTAIALPLRHLVKVNSAFFALDKPIQRFILLHECGHMKNWDMHAETIVSLVSAIASCILFPSHPFLATIGISLIACSILSSIQERRADAFAISHASVKELEGGLTFFKKEEEKKEKKDLQRWESCATMIDKFCFLIFEFCHDLLKEHPLDSSRIIAIQKELQKREALCLDTPLSSLA